MRFRIARTGALDEDDFLRLLVIRWPQHMAASGPRRRAETFKLETVEDVRVATGAVFAQFLLAVEVETGGDDDGANLHFGNARAPVVVDGAGFADIGTLAADDRVEAQTGALVQRVGGRDGLRERNMDGSPVGQADIVLIGHRHRTDIGAVVADLAGFGINEDRLGLDPGLEVADKAGDAVDLALYHQRDLGMLGHLDHLRRQDALRAIQGREGLGQLQHVAADGRLLLDQHDFETGIGKVEGGLDAGDTAADDQHAPGHRHADGL